MDEWDVIDSNGCYDLEVYGPNGYFHKFSGNINDDEPEIQLEYDQINGGIFVLLRNSSSVPMHIEIVANAYDYKKAEVVSLGAGELLRKYIGLRESGNWYDFTIKTKAGFLHRFAGRVETGKHSISDPAMATEI